MGEGATCYLVESPGLMRWAEAVHSSIDGPVPVSGHPLLPDISADHVEDEPEDNLPEFEGEHACDSEQQADQRTGETDQSDERTVH